MKQPIKRRGRPSLGDASRVIMVNLRINAEERAALDAASAKQNTTNANLIRKLLRAYLKLPKE